MRKASGFQKGSSCYTCRCCGRKTRSTGRGDNEWVGMCAECYDMGGIENQIQDGDFENEAEKQELIEEIKFLANIITQHGGCPRSDYI